MHHSVELLIVKTCALLLVMPNVLSDQELNMEGNIFTAARELQRKQQAVLEDADNPTSIEIRRRLMELVTEMARDKVL